MKRYVSLLAFLFLLGLGAETYAIHETTTAETQITLPGADAVKLHEYITKTRPYTEWDLWPGKGKMYKGSQPHGDYLTTYVNADGMFDIRKKKRSLSEGTIIVKESYGADKNFTALSVMFKIAGYNRSAGDWFWAKYDHSGKVLASGRVEACIKCHEKKNDNDYIFTGDLKK